MNLFKKIELSSGENAESFYFKANPLISINSNIKKNDFLANYSFNIKSLSKKLFSPFSGKIKYIFESKEIKLVYSNAELPEESVIKVFEVEECAHSIIYNDICSECFELRPHHENFKLNENEKLTVDKNFIKEKLDNMLAGKKLILLLDLDNTVLHSLQTSKNKIAEFLENSNDSGFYFLNFDGKEQMILKLRPFFWEFGEKVKDLFEIYVYTFGTRQYAEKVLSQIDPKEIILKVI